jgi:hypothetical protein
MKQYNLKPNAAIQNAHKKLQEGGLFDITPNFDSQLTEALKHRVMHVELQLLEIIEQFKSFGYTHLGLNEFIREDGVYGNLQVNINTEDDSSVVELRWSDGTVEEQTYPLDMLRPTYRIVT